MCQVSCYIDNGILSEGLADLKLCHIDDEDETTMENETNMQEKIQALDTYKMEANESFQGPYNINYEHEPKEQVQNADGSQNNSQGLEIEQTTSPLVIKKKKSNMHLLIPWRISSQIQLKLDLRVIVLLVLLSPSLNQRLMMKHYNKTNE